MEVVPSGAYDSAICLEVLEHIPNPSKAISEIYRILKPGGILVVSVPHLSRLHEEPYDFFRYTHYGLRALLEGAGFQVLQMERRGGLNSFLSHQISLILVGLTWSVPVLKQIVFVMNQWLIVRPSYFLDAHLDRSGKFALGYTCVVQKPSSA
jgi:SAM-dependent methyltransferase